jgi:hypothetical protein
VTTIGVLRASQRATIGMVIVVVIAAVSLHGGPAAGQLEPKPTGVTSTTGPVINRRGLLTQPRALGGGQFRFEPPVNERPRMTAGGALTTATRAIRAKVRGTRHEVFFALFSATSPAQHNADGTSTPVFRRRPVWVVRFPAVVGRRQSGIVQRKNSPTTTSLEVVTEVVAIIDDRSGSLILSSEYLSESTTTSSTPTPVA